MNSCLKFSHSLLFPCKQGNCSVQLVGHLCVGLGAVCSYSRGLVFLGAFSGLGGERMLKRGGGTCCFPLLSLEVGLTTLGQLPVQQRALLWHGHWPILAFLMSSHMFQITTMFFPPSLSLGNFLMLQHPFQLSQVFLQSSHQGAHPVTASKSSFNHTAVKSSVWNS